MKLENIPSDGSNNSDDGKEDKLTFLPPASECEPGSDEEDNKTVVLIVSETQSVPSSPDTNLVSSIPAELSIITPSSKAERIAIEVLEDDIDILSSLKSLPTEKESSAIDFKTQNSKSYAASKKVGRVDEKSSDDELYSCSTCGKKFRTHHGYINHFAEHDKKHECSVCGKAYAHVSSLQYHLAVVWMGFLRCST